MKTAYAVCVVGGLLFGLLIGAREWATDTMQRALVSMLAGGELAITIILARSIARKARLR